MTDSGSIVGERALRVLDPRPDARVRLICFPHAGGSASTFRDWNALLPSWIEPIAVQMPGRENRMVEDPHVRMEPLAAELGAALAPLMVGTVAFCGTSMGARVARVVIDWLIQRSLPVPTHLFVAASAAPQAGVRVPGWDESDERLMDYMRDMGGTADLIWDNPSILAMQLPLVRADLTVVATCSPSDSPPIDLPIVGFAGSEDQFATVDRMQLWSQETSDRFELHTVAGGHFFPDEGRDFMLATIVRHLARTVQQPTSASAARNDNPTTTDQRNANQGDRE